MGWQSTVLVREGKVTHRERLMETATATEKWKMAGEPVRRSHSSFCAKAR